MTTYIHGTKAAVVHGAVDLSPWMSEATASASMETGDTSHFGSTAKTYIIGQHDATFSGSGLYDGTAGAIQPHMAQIIDTEVYGGPNVPVTFAPEGLVIGGSALMGLAKQTSYEVHSVVSDVESVTFQMQINGGMSYGSILATPEQITSTFEGPSVDHTVPTTRGGRVFAHVHENGTDGNVTVSLQHSIDGSVWVDLAILPAVPAEQESAYRTMEFTGTVNQYLRIVTTLSGVGTASVTASASRN